MDGPGTSAASVCQWNLYFFPFLFFFFFFLMDMVLAVHQSLSSSVSSCGAKGCSKSSCFSFGHSDSICYYDEFFFFYCSLVQKTPVCLICNKCFQLPLAAMTDGKTIKCKRAPQRVFLVFLSSFFNPCWTVFFFSKYTSMFLSVCFLSTYCLHCSSQCLAD